jgi:hypothetical protein
MGNKKIFKTPLDENLSKSLLGNPSQVDGCTIWERLSNAIGELSQAVVEANESLQESPVMPIVASSAARMANKRGNPSVRVADDGTVVLEIHYSSKKKVDNANKRQWKSDLPLLADLREQADQLGLDISHLGRARKQIHEYIQNHLRTEPEASSDILGGGESIPVPKPTNPRVKTAPAVSAPTVVDTEDIFADDSGTSEESLVEVGPTPTVTTMPSMSSMAAKVKKSKEDNKKKSRLSTLSEQAEELDLDQILSGDNPPK